MTQANDPVETAELIAFVRVVDEKSLTRAAAKLAVPRATVGRRLARLEERLGVRLLRRTTRSLQLTDAGEAFYRHARIVLDAVAQAESSVKRSDGVIRGDVRVSVPPIGDESFFDMVTSFMKKHPAVHIQVDASARVVDLLREGYDVALRATAELQPGLVARTVARHRVVAVASPEYLEKHGTPRTAKDLRKHRCLTGFARGELPQAMWPVGRGVQRIDSAFASNDLNLLREAAVRGLGIALLPELVLGDLLASGALVQVLPGIVEAENRLSIVYPEREFLPPQVKAFAEELAKWAPALQRNVRRGKRS